jgi:hypothetical protein
MITTAEFPDVSLGETERFNVAKHYKEIKKTCPECQKKYWTPVHKDYQYCRDCAIKPGRLYTRMLNTGWDETYISLAEDDPYISMAIKGLILPGNWVKYPRYLMAKKLGRCLTKKEYVHFRNNLTREIVESNLFITSNRWDRKEITS